MAGKNWDRFGWERIKDGLGLVGQHMVIYKVGGALCGPGHQWVLSNEYEQIVLHIVSPMLR